MIGKKNVCAITGASGYVGGRIRDYFIENGWIVHELTRDLRKLRVDDRFVVSYSLAGEIHPGVLSVLEKSDLLIHCAYDFRLVDWRSMWEVNVNGSVKLLNGAKSVGVDKIIVLSTMSAFDGCKSRYGMAKLAIEKEALKIGAIIVRPGLVFGRSPGGTVGALKRIVAVSRVIPLIGNGSQILHTAHEDDLCNLIFRLSTEKISNILEPIIAAEEDGKTFRNILELLANSIGRDVIFIPLPWRLVWAVLKVMEMTGLRVGLRSDSVMSLVNLEPKPNFELIKQIGVHFRQFNSETVI